MPEAARVGNPSDTVLVATSAADAAGGGEHDTAGAQPQAPDRQGEGEGPGGAQIRLRAMEAAPAAEVHHVRGAAEVQPAVRGTWPCLHLVHSGDGSAGAGGQAEDRSPPGQLPEISVTHESDDARSSNGWQKSTGALKILPEWLSVAQGLGRWIRSGFGGGAGTQRGAARQGDRPPGQRKRPNSDTHQGQVLSDSLHLQGFVLPETHSAQLPGQLQSPCQECRLRRMHPRAFSLLSCVRQEEPASAATTLSASSLGKCNAKNYFSFHTSLLRS